MGQQRQRHDADLARGPLLPPEPAAAVGGCHGHGVDLSSGRGPSEQDSDPGDARPWISPDVPVAYTAEDHFGGRDSVLDAVLTTLKKERRILKSKLIRIIAHPLPGTREIHCLHLSEDSHGARPPTKGAAR